MDKLKATDYAVMCVLILFIFLAGYHGQTEPVGKDTPGGYSRWSNMHDPYYHVCERRKHIRCV